jgi:hypothetical protein
MPHTTRITDMLILLVLQLVSSPLRPDLTPGEAKPTTRAAVCAVPWKADLSSAVPSTLWRQVLTRYGIAWERRGAYLATLVVPTALGGVISLANVWPAAKAAPLGHACKQKVEHRIYDRLCAGVAIQHLSDAQQQAGTGWINEWRACQ